MASRYNVLLMVLDDVNFDGWAKMRRLATRVLPAGDPGKWVDFDRTYAQYALCGPSRYTILTGRYARHLGVYSHFNAQGTLLDTEDPAIVDYQSASLRAADLLHGPHTLPVWLQASGYRTAGFGKYNNEYPFFQGDAYNPPGFDDNDWCLDDHSLKSVGGGATYPGHVGHNGPDYFTFVRNRGDGTTTTNATLDAWTGVGTTQGNRVLSPKTQTDYATDLYSWQVRDWMTTAPEPWFGFWALRAAHNTIVVPARHAGLTQSVFSGDSPATTVNIGTAEDPAGFNEADISDKPTWFQATYPAQLSGGVQTSLRAEQVAAWRALQAVDEAIYDIVQQLSAATSPNPTTGVDEPTIDHTVIMVTNDNGYSRGVNRAEAKCMPYEAAIRSRLIMRHPDIVDPDGGSYDPKQPGQHTDHALVSLVDIAPTIARIAGVRPTRAFDGMDLTPRVLNTRFGWRRELRGEFNRTLGDNSTVPTHSWIVAQEPYNEIENAELAQLYKYILIPPSDAAYAASGGLGTWAAAEDEFYDLTADEGERTNLNNDPSFAALKADMSNRRQRLHSV